MQKTFCDVCKQEVTEETKVNAGQSLEPRSVVFGEKETPIATIALTRTSGDGDVCLNCLVEALVPLKTRAVAPKL